MVHTRPSVGDQCPLTRGHTLLLYAGLRDELGRCGGLL